jgi:hypothetical protein
MPRASTPLVQQILANVEFHDKVFKHMGLAPLVLDQRLAQHETLALSPAELRRAALGLRVESLLDRAGARIFTPSPPSVGGDAEGSPSDDEVVWQGTVPPPPAPTWHGVAEGQLGGALAPAGLAALTSAVSSAVHFGASKEQKAIKAIFEAYTRRDRPTQPGAPYRKDPVLGAVAHMLAEVGYHYGHSTLGLTERDPSKPLDQVCAPTTLLLRRHVAVGGHAHVHCAHAPSPRPPPSLPPLAVRSPA